MESSIPYEDTLDYYFEQNPEELKAHLQSHDTIMPSEPEKAMLEKEFFGSSDSFRDFMQHNFIEPRPLESLVKTFYDKYVYAIGKVNSLQDNNNALKEQVKDLKNENNGLKKQIGESKQDVRPYSSDRYAHEYNYIPPQNVSMEEELLSSYFKNPSFMNNFNQPYLNLMFYKEAHRIIHSGMIAQQTRLTQATVSSYLRKIEQLDVAGGPFQIKQITQTESTNDPLIVQTYINELEQHFLARELIQFTSEVQREAFVGETVEGIKWSYEKVRGKVRGDLRRKKEDVKVKIDDFVEYIRNLSFRTLELLPLRFRKSYNLPESIKSIRTEVRELLYREGKPLISTGYSELDKSTHGIRQNKLYLFGARPKNGKTTVSINIADEVMAQDYPVGILSYELTYEEILHKFIAKRAKLDLEKFEFFDKNENPFTLEEQERFEIATKQVEQLPLYLRGGKPSSLDHVVAQCKHMKILHPDMPLIIIDGLQAFAPLVPPRGNKSDYFYYVLTVLKKDVAEELGVTVMLNAQLKADVETYKNGKKPKSIGDFSDCKGIPEVADGAFLLWRPEHYFPDKEEFKNWINVHPVELRSSGRKDKQFKLGMDIKYALMSNYKNE
jgi:replicative DNA helicase